MAETTQAISKFNENNTFIYGEGKNSRGRELVKLRLKLFFENKGFSVRYNNNQIRGGRKEEAGLYVDNFDKEKNENYWEQFLKYEKELMAMSDEDLKTKDQIDLLKCKKNLILQGAPGTGKTYSTAELALKIIHSKSENSNSTQQTSSTRANIMKEYNRYLINKFIKYEDVTKKTGDVTVEKKEDKKFGEIADDKQIAFVTFHQSMDYEDFIEGIKPVSVGDSVHYPVKSGIFKAIANKAKENPDKNYVLIIDEINRGNVSKIFGELITLLEADKRTCWKWEPENKLRDTDHSKEDQKKFVLVEDLDKNPNAIKVVLPYSQEEFSVPSNLYIIGTMNTTDRSAGSLDYAIRRRFAFVTLTNPEKVEDSNADKLYKAVKLFIQKNSANSEMDFEDLMVGHSYFMDPKNEDNNWLQMKWQYEILPLLMEYYKDGLLTSSPKITNSDSYGSWLKNVNEKYPNG